MDLTMGFKRVLEGLGRGLGRVLGCQRRLQGAREEFNTQEYVRGREEHEQARGKLTQG